MAAMSGELSSALYRKISEQVELIDHLISMVPRDRLEWRPSPEFHSQAEEHEARPLLSLGYLLGHLLDCMAGFCAAVYKMDPVRFEEMNELRALPVNFCVEPEEARVRVKQYAGCLNKAFGQLTDDDLAMPLPTIFVPSGELALTVLLGNLEHLINHKFQLFMYLRLLGVPVSTRDLYRIRGE